MATPEKEQENLLKERLGKPPTRADILRNQLKQRRFFDSGDYAMSKAGKKPEAGQDIGSEHPIPEQIPHRSALLAAHGNVSPVRRPSTLAQGSDNVRVAATPESSTHKSDEEAISD